MAFNTTIAGLGDNKLDVYGATPTAVFTITFGGADTYVAGGLALTQANFGLSRPIAGVHVMGVNTAGIPFQYLWNTQTQKLQFQNVNVGLASTPAPLQDLTAATSIANVVLTVLVIAQR